ncbi:MAG: MerR family transcriptional regulator [Anaerolineales bacterium]|nr:MerR family transcriptional regulator [Anaerolineales bacterium]
MFRIGEFSKFSRVSVRMLRHYDQLGLLRPAHVDPATEYRYYTADQLVRLHRIIALQDIGFSLEQIRGLLVERPVSAEEMSGMLLLKQAELQTKVQGDLERLNRIAERIRQVEESETAHYDVVVRQVEPLRVASIRLAQGGNPDLTPVFEELEFYVGRYKARREEPPLALYFGDEAGGGDIAVAVPLKADVQPSDRVEVTELPAVTMACVVHRGGYENIHLAVGVLMRWVQANTYRTVQAAPMREVYYRFGADLQGYQLPAVYLTDQNDEFVTEIQIPIERN